MKNYRNIFFGKAFNDQQAYKLAGDVTLMSIAGQRVVIIDHPPTAGLVPLIERLEAIGAEVHLRDHHGDSDRDGETVARCREILGDRAVISTRAVDPACASLVETDEFHDDIVITDVDQDGVMAALKAVGISYPELESDAAVLDGPHSGKTEENLSPIGFALVRAWGAIPGFGAPDHDEVFLEVVGAFADLVEGEPWAEAAIGRLIEAYERKVEASKELAKTAEESFAGFRLLEAPAGAEFDPPTLAAELDRGVLVSGRSVSTGPIASKPGGFGRQVSLARTKAGEEAGIDLAALVPDEWARGPAEGVISNTPFLLHLSPERWEEFRAILRAALLS